MENIYEDVLSELLKTGRGFSLDFDITVEPGEPLKQISDKPKTIIGGLSEEEMIMVDRIFDWGEHSFSNILQGQPESGQIFDYYARAYGNGNAVGAKDGEVFFYNANSHDIKVVGSIDDLGALAELAGF